MFTPRNTQEAQHDISTPRDTREPQNVSTLRDTRKALGDITNATDEEASQRREERNKQQWKSRAEMSIEQRDEINKKQREYREPNKASPSAAFADTMWLTLAPPGINENAGPHDENTPNILAANDNVETDGYEYHTHVSIGTSTIRSSALSVAHREDDAETLPADSADARRKQRNTRERKRRAEMTDQQREEINRKQREYRARKKATIQNITTTSAVSQTVSASSPAGVGFGTRLPTILENDESADPRVWLHRNDNYFPRARGPCTVTSGTLPTYGESDDDDDDCVMLNGDPDKPEEEGGSSRDAAEDELQIVAEKGEIACRDFPHPRHLCATLPFSTSSHASHCNMCHCYVCDCRAPCPFWVHHCHATDKDSKWKELRQSKSKSQPNPKQSLPQHFNRSVTTGPSWQHSVNVTGLSGRFVAPSPMPSTIPRYGSNGAQVAPPLYTSSNGNHLQPSVSSYYGGLVEPAWPHASSQPAQFSLGVHDSAETFQSCPCPPQFPVGAPMGSQFPVGTPMGSHGHQYRPPSYPQLAPNISVAVGTGVPLSWHSSLNALAQGTQRPQVPLPGIMSKESLGSLAHQLGLPADYNDNQPLRQQATSTSTPQYQHMHPRDVLLAQGALKKRRLWQQLSQIGASSGHNSSNHAPGATALSSSSVQIQQPLPQLKPGTVLSSSSAQIQQPLPQLKPGTVLSSGSAQIQQLLSQSKSQSSVTPSKTAPNTLYRPRQ